jgi:hypothetical protein
MAGVERMFWLPPVKAGDIASWVAPGLVQDSGTPVGGGGIAWTLPAPANSTSAGLPGQISYDSSGNFYLAYALNMWAKFIPIIPF